MLKLEKAAEGYPDTVRRPQSLLSWGSNVIKVLTRVRRQQKSWLREKPGEDILATSAYPDRIVSIRLLH